MIMTNFTDHIYSLVGCDNTAYAQQSSNANQVTSSSCNNCSEVEHNLLVV